MGEPETLESTRQYVVDVSEGMPAKEEPPMIPEWAAGWDPPIGYRVPPATLRMLEEHGKDSSRQILERANRSWDLSTPFPLPRKLPQCFCGNPDPRFVPRYWLFHDYHSDEKHRIRRRCDVSLKCAHCGLVLLFGVVIPDGHPGPPSGRYMWEQCREWLNSLPDEARYGRPACEGQISILDALEGE